MESHPIKYYYSKLKTAIVRSSQKSRCREISIIWNNQNATYETTPKQSHRIQSDHFVTFAM